MRRVFQLGLGLSAATALLLAAGLPAQNLCERVDMKPVLSLEQVQQNELIEFIVELSGLKYQEEWPADISGMTPEQYYQMEVQLLVDKGFPPMFLEIEPDRSEQFKHWSDAVAIGLSGARDFAREEVVAAADEMSEYIDRIVEERRHAPREDLISALVAAEGGDALTADEVRAFVVLLLIAGNETTTNLIGNAMNALLAHPGQLDRVARDRSLIPAMIEEALRYDSPVQGIPRKLVQDVDLAGVTLPKEAFLMVLFASANRDEQHFAEPERFDIDRRTRDHIAFGNGIHFCLGAALARLEARVAFETLFERCRGFRLDSAEVPMVESMLLRGPQSLPLSFTSA